MIKKWLFKVNVLITLIVLMIFQIVPLNGVMRFEEVYAATEINVALGKNYSSSESQLEPSYAFDGYKEHSAYDEFKFWASENLANNKPENPPWLQVDLGSPHTINRFVVIGSGQLPNDNTAKSITLKGSLDGVNFETVKASNDVPLDPTTGVVTHEGVFSSPINYRYVRVEVTEVSWDGGDIPYAGILEFELYGQPAIGDTVAPTLGNSGTISVSNVTSSGGTLDWTKATDNVTNQEDLEYRVYQSTSSNFNTVSEVEIGTPLGNGFTKDLITWNVTDLSPDTTYYFNVIVRDAAGNKNVYTMQQVTTHNLKSSNANLKSLSLSPISINEPFDPNTVSYTATLPYGTTAIPVTAIAADSKATVNVVGASNGKVILDADGTTDILVEVTAEDGTVKTYTITVTKAQPSNNADLSNLTISTGPLSPAFIKDTVNYTAIVPFTTSNMIVTPTLDDSKATVKLMIRNGQVPQHETLMLNMGKNIIDIIVTAENQPITKTYTVNVYRLFPPPFVTADDYTNILLGIDNSMEYQINGGEWTTFDLVNSPDLSGNKRVKVRYSANILTGEPASEEVTLNFTENPKTESASPNVTPATTEEDTISMNGLVITPNVQDIGDVTHYKISEITGGTLFKNDGTFTIDNGGFITKADGEAGLKFRPDADANSTAGDTFSFKIQAALDGEGRGLSNPTTASITVAEVNDEPIAMQDTLPSIGKNSPSFMVPVATLLNNDSVGPINENVQTLTITNVKDAVGGTVSLDGNNIIFTPDSNYRGMASFEYTVQDNGTTNGVASPETASATVEFTVVAKPFIQLKGDSNIYIALGSSYTESGFSATDELDGDLADRVIITGTVDTNQLGTYQLKYNVTNTSKTSAEEVTRNVHIVSANLQTLSVSSGNLTPSFDPAQTDYNLNVPSNMTSINVTASTLDGTASATLNGEGIGNSGDQSIALQSGVNKVLMVVTAQGGMTKTYTLEITRELTNTEVPTILNQPANPTVSVGGEANLSVDAIATNGELSYQWYSNTTNSSTGGTVIAGATSATYSAPTAIAGITYYYVKVTNTDNNATGNKTAMTKSSAATVTVNAKSTNAYLGDLALSSGVLNPVFTKHRETYVVNFPNSVTNITFTPIVEDIGKATVTVNGQSSTTAIPLTIGTNVIQVVVTAEDGVTKNTYSITVNRAQPSSSGGGDGPKPVPQPQPEIPPTPDATPDATPDPTPDPTLSPQPTTEQIVVDVDGNNGSNLTKTPIVRTTEPNGTVKDKVAMTDAIAKETVQKAKEQGVDTARIIIPDIKDKVSEVLIEVPKSALDELNNGNLKLEIVTPNAVISIPTKSIDNFNGNLYFRVVPIKSDSEKQQVVERAKNESLIQEAVGNNTVQVIGRPMEIETNMQNREVSIVLLLTASLPKNAAERENILNNLGVYIEHSDGSKELIKGAVVKMQDGSEGLQFTVNKFSTFTMVYLEGWEEEVADETVHTPYIKGYGDNEFRPEAPVTRAQMATMLAININGTPSTKIYEDISTNHGAYAAIMEVKGAGIMKGKNATTFDPNGTVTRAQMAAIVYRWVQNQCKQDATSYVSCAILPNIPVLNFIDVKDNHWAKEAMYFTKAAAIMVGDGKSQFQPEENLTRAQAVKVLNRLFKRGPITGIATPSFKDVPTTHWAFGEIEEAAREHTSSLDIKE